MREAGTSDAPERGRGVSRWIEGLGVVAALASIATLLLRAYELQPYSDPVHWFLFGRHFAQSFSRTELAYGFPLLVSGAIRIAGRDAAYLVNLPVLVALAALLYAFARLHVARRSGEPELGPVAGGAALLLLVWLDTGPLLRLVNPFRDPLAHLLVLVSCALVLHYRRDAGRRGWEVAAAGGALGLACSTREASVLMLLPLLLYALVARRSEPRLAVLRPMLVFGMAFTVAIAPFLVQNALVSGNPLLPGQAAATYEEQGLVPGVRGAHYAEQWPLLGAALLEHYGPIGLALIAAGLVGGVVRRNPAVLALSAPAGMLYALFYAGYERVVPRYLFVLELFALPIAGFGAAWILRLALTPACRARPALGRMLASAWALLLFAAATWLGLAVSGAPRERIRLEDATAFVRHVETAVGSDATLVGTRPVIDVVRAFGDLATEVPPDRWNLRFSLASYFDAPGRHYLLSNDPVAVNIVESAYDLVDAVRFDPEDYAFGGEIGNSPIRLARVVPWTRLLSTQHVAARQTGEFALVLDVGRLAQRRNVPVDVLWNGEQVGETPRHRIDVFRVSVPHAPSRFDVSLASEQPVPGRFGATLVPLDAPLALSFQEEGLEPFIDRFSSSFMMRPKLGYPTLTSTGYMDVPTVAPGGAAYIVKARVGLLRGFGSSPVAVTMSVAGRPLSEIALGSPLIGAGDERWKWRSGLFVLAPEVVRDGNTRVQWRLAAADSGTSGGPAAPGPIVALRGLRIFREPLREDLRIDLTSARSVRFLENGFGPRHGEGRWTSGEAVLRLVAARSDDPTRLTVTYRSASSPPSFFLDGRPLRGTATRESLGTDERVTERFEIGTLDGVDSRLEIRSATRPEQGRHVGLLLESVDFARGG